MWCKWNSRHSGQRLEGDLRARKILIRPIGIIQIALEYRGRLSSYVLFVRSLIKVPLVSAIREIPEVYFFNALPVVHQESTAVVSGEWLPTSLSPLSSLWTGPRRRYSGEHVVPVQGSFRSDVRWIWRRGRDSECGNRPLLFPSWAMRDKNSGSHNSLSSWFEIWIRSRQEPS